MVTRPEAAVDPTVIGSIFCGTLCCIIVLVVVVIVGFKLLKGGGDGPEGQIEQDGPSSPFAHTGPEVGPLPGAKPAAPGAKPAAPVAKPAAPAAKPAAPAAKPAPPIMRSRPAPAPAEPSPVLVESVPTLDPFAPTTKYTDDDHAAPGLQAAPTQKVEPGRPIAPATGSPVVTDRAPVLDPGATFPEGISPPASKRIGPKPRKAPRTGGKSTPPPPPPPGVAGLQPINPADVGGDEAATVLLKRPSKKPD